jgi:hypothetical protein
MSLGIQSRAHRWERWPRSCVRMCRCSPCYFKNLDHWLNLKVFSLGFTSERLN